MRAVTDEEDLNALRLAGIGLIHNPDGQVLHWVTCSHVARMGPRGKLHFADAAQASRWLSADARRQWSWCPRCRLQSAPTATGQPPERRVGVAVSCPEGELSDYVPFEPRMDAQRMRRQALRDRLAGLVVPPGKLLHAAYRRAPPSGADVENVLLYNIQGAGLGKAMANGVRFELAPEDLAVDAYSYRAAAVDAGFDHWESRETVATFGETPLVSASLVDTWWALASERVARAGTLGADAPFGLRMHLVGPVPGLTVDVVKKVGDGVVCAMQAQVGGKNLDESARRIADRHQMDVNQVRARLTDASGAVLGTTDRLIGLRGTYVQWSPADHRCVAAEVLFTQAEHWSLAGEVFAAVRSLRAG